MNHQINSIEEQFVGGETEKSRRTNLDPELTAKGQEQKFGAILKAQLFSRGYSVAVPEPDTGEDIWLGGPVGSATETPARQIYRAQLKSVYSFEPTKTTAKRTFESNDYTSTIDYAISQPKFVYFIGIRDERLEADTGALFHIGCLPAKGFLSEIRRKFPDAGINKDRFYMQFIVESEGWPINRPKILVNVRRAQNFDVTRFFSDFEVGLRISSSIEPAPDLVIVPGQRTPRAQSAMRQ